MRLSDAIATGRVLDTIGCALDKGMAAVEGTTEGRWWKARYKWPWMEHAPKHCDRCFHPACEVGRKGGAAIYRVYDYHVIQKEDMTLDQLIDYVRSIEPPEEAKSPETELLETVSETQCQLR